MKKCKYVLCDQMINPVHGRHVYCSEECKSAGRSARGQIGRCKYIPCSKDFTMRHGIHSYCSALCRHRAQWIRQRNRPEQRERHRLYNVRYRERNRGKFNDRVKRTSFKSKYGIEWDEKIIRIAQQGHRCANQYCDSKPKSDTGWHTDHDHSTGKLRGMICRSCNLILGLAKDDPEILQGLIDYLQLHAVSDIQMVLTKRPK
jgi:hypothetical protein